MSKEIYSKSVSRSKDEAAASDCYGVRDGVLVNYCGKDAYVFIPNSVTDIDGKAFYHNNNIRTVVIPDSIKSIAAEAFSGCTSLEAIDISSAVTDIGEYAFAGCTSLKKIYFRGTETQWNAISKGYGWDLNIEKYDIVYKNSDTTELCEITDDGTLLQYDNSAENVIIPDSVKKIGARIFGNNNSKVKSITIPGAVHSIDSNAFFGCTMLETIVTEKTNPVYISDGNCLIERNTGILIAGCRTGVIPKYVKGIGDYAFATREGVTYLSIPESVKSFGTGILDYSSVKTIVYQGTSEQWEKIDKAEQWSPFYEYKIISEGDLQKQKNNFAQDFEIEDGVLKKYNGSAKEIFIPSSVICIGEWAFYGCSSSSIFIPSSVTSICEAAFYGCSSLKIYYCGNETQWKKMQIDDSTIKEWKIIFNAAPAALMIKLKNNIAESISQLFAITNQIRARAAFRFNARIKNGVLIKYKGKAKEVFIPSFVTSIGEWAFNGCKSLTSISIPASVTSIGEWAFSYCSALTSIIIPDSVTSIGDSTFSGCNSLTSISIPASVTSIGDSAFSGCSSLTSITIPDSVTSIGTWAFYGCKSLTSITVDSNNKVYRSENNCIIELKTNTLVAGCKNSVIPSSVTSIGKAAFSYCSALTSITIPDSVTSIGEWAFSDCNSLTSITIPDSVTSIGNSAFSDCASLSSMTVDSNNNVYRSENNCIIERKTNTLVAGCKNSVIPSSVTSIGEEAFGGCSSLTSISIPASVTNIGEWAFFGCSSLKTVYYQGSEEQWKKIQIYDTTIKECKIIFFTPSQTSNSKSYQDENFIRDAQIENGVLIKYKGNAKEVVIPSAVTSIGKEAFYGCKSLTSLTIPDSVTSIGKWAFSGCKSLASITIPDSVTSIGMWAFYGCSSLASITVDSNNKVYRSENNCIIERETNTLVAGCKNSVIPSSVTSIGERAFYDCSSLASISIPDSVTSIGERAFSRCSSLATTAL